jgi:P-type Cu+ transporter
VFSPAGDITAVVRQAACVQQGSLHPLAKAVTNAAATQQLALEPLEAFENATGRGVRGVIAGRSVIVGHSQWLHELGIDLAPLQRSIDEFEKRGLTTAVVAEDRFPLGVIGFADPLRSTSAAAVAALRQQGCRVVLLSGDSETIVADVGQKLGVDESQGRLLPEGKLAFVQTMQAAGHRVAMVGDGLNDAPALAAADVGIALSGGTDVAQQTARIVLMRPEPILVVAVLDIAKRTVRKIRQNIFWAFAYNCVGLPLAAFGRLSPVVAGLAMALSSISVVTSSLLLRNWRPRLTA